MLCMLFPADDCRKRWKSWRDTHRRERRKEKESCRSGAEVSTSRPWRYSQIMAFLNPFTEDRATSSNLPTGDSRGQRDGGITVEDADADNEFCNLCHLNCPETLKPHHTHSHSHPQPHPHSHPHHHHHHHLHHHHLPPGRGLGLGRKRGHMKIPSLPLRGNSCVLWRRL